MSCDPSLSRWDAPVEDPVARRVGHDLEAPLLEAGDHMGIVPGVEEKNELVALDEHRRAGEARAVHNDGTLEVSFERPRDLESDSLKRNPGAVCQTRLGDHPSHHHRRRALRELLDAHPEKSGGQAGGGQ